MKSTLLRTVAAAVVVTLASHLHAAEPGDVFNLSNWELQIADGSSSITGATLENNYTNAPYFFLDENNYMVMWCPVNGETTPNSSYPRAELREKKSGGDWQLHTGTRTLTVTLRVTKEPSNKRLIIGQIKGNNSGSEVCKLYWNDGAITARWKNNSGSEITESIGTGFALNSDLTFSIKSVNGNVTAKVTQGAKTGTQSNNYNTSSTADDFWKNDRYYFKFGAYAQDNTGNSDEGARVRVKSFSVSHQ